MSQQFTILFDLDGTIVDTAPDLISAHNHVMRKFGFQEKGLSEIKKLAGKGAWIMMQRSFKNQITDEIMKKKMVAEFLSFYSKNIDKKSKVIDGLVKFLEWAKKNNISMAVCTNKTEYLAIDLLKKIGIYEFFEYVAGHNTFDYCKPDPRHLTSVIEILNGDIKKTLMIGDSETDANAAKSAGIPIILLEDGYTEKKTTEIYHNHLVKDFIGIEKIVSKYL